MKNYAKQDEELIRKIHNILKRKMLSHWFNDDEILKLADRLPAYIGTHFDANVV